MESAVGMSWCHDGGDGRVAQHHAVAMTVFLPSISDISYICSFLTISSV